MKVEIRKSGIKGVGLFALEDAQAGTRVFILRGKKVNDAEADRWCESGRARYDDPFQISKDEYLMLDPASLALNHSCAPNLGVRGERTLVALRRIRAGEELFYDYSTTVGKDEPGEGPWSMNCKCGAANCRKKIGNWQSLPPRRLRSYLARGALTRFVRSQREAGILDR